MLNRNTSNAGTATGAPANLESSIAVNSKNTWTGATSGNCSNWTLSLSSYSSMYGTSGEISSSWASATTTKCNSKLNLYCAQQAN